jgi:hypothetical protein
MDVVGKIGAVAPLQIIGRAANVGVAGVVTTFTDIEVVVVQGCPTFGVNK